MTAKVRKLKTRDEASPTPARKLGPHGAVLWKSIQAEYAIEDAGGRDAVASVTGARPRRKMPRGCRS